MTPNFFVDAFGWLSSAAVVIAYGLISMNKLDSKSRIYQWLNILGSIGLAVNSAYYRAFPSTVVNIVWMIIAGVALIRISRRFPQRTPTAN
jgi:hypothetical protein